jgi:hypothetical protein
MGGPLVHTNDIGSLDNADTGMPLMQQSLELTPDSHQNKTQGFVFTHCFQRSMDDNRGTAITAHSINGNGDRRVHHSSMRHRSEEIPDELLVASLNYLLATVETVRRHVVATMNFTSCCVGRQSSSTQCVV